MPEDLQHISQLTCLKGVIVAGSVLGSEMPLQLKSHRKRSQSPIRRMPEVKLQCLPGASTSLRVPEECRRMLEGYSLTHAFALKSRGGTRVACGYTVWQECWEGLKPSSPSSRVFITVRMEVSPPEGPWQCPVRQGMGSGQMVSSSMVRDYKSCFETWWWWGQRQKLHVRVLLCKEKQAV